MKVIAFTRPCPICGFDEIKYEAHKANMLDRFHNKVRPFEEFCLITFKDRISNQIVVECQNCGTHFLLHEKTIEETITQFNAGAELCTK